MTRKKLGERLVEAKLITEEQLKKALDEQNRNGGRIGTILVELGFIKEYELIEVLKEQLKIPALLVGHLKIPLSVIEMVPKEFAYKYKVLPIAYKDRCLTLAMSDPSDTAVISAIESITRCQVKPVIAMEKSLEEAIKRYYREK